MLNKITGWESRTVPPLYVLMGKSLVKTGHWGNLGRLLFPRENAGHKSEDLRNGFSSPLREYGGVRCRRKTAAVLFLQAPQLIAF